MTNLFGQPWVSTNLANRAPMLPAAACACASCAAEVRRSEGRAVRRASWYSWAWRPWFQDVSTQRRPLACGRGQPPPAAPHAGRTRLHVDPWPRPLACGRSQRRSVTLQATPAIEVAAPAVTSESLPRSRIRTSSTLAHRELMWPVVAGAWASWVAEARGSRGARRSDTRRSEGQAMAAVVSLRSAAAAPACM